MAGKDDTVMGTTQEYIPKYKVTISISQSYQGKDYNDKVTENWRDVATTEVETGIDFSKKVFRAASKLISESENE